MKTVTISVVVTWGGGVKVFHVDYRLTVFNDNLQAPFTFKVII